MLPYLREVTRSQQLELCVQLLDLSPEGGMLALLLGTGLDTTLEEALDVAFQLSD